MASAQLFRFPGLGAFIRSVGAFPKTKFSKDPKAMDHLFQLYEDGRSIVIFPEGTRTWDGRQTTIRPGIGQLIKQLDARVVTVRILTGHLHRPRWASHARSVPVLVEYDAPRTFSKDMTAEQITAEIASSLLIDIESIQPPPGSSGKHLAMGLPGYLWACPACMKMETLAVEKEDKDQIGCTDCGAVWRLDLACWMHPEGGQGEAMTVATAYERVLEHYGDPPIADRAHFETEGVVLESTFARIGRLSRGERKPSPLAEGRLRLYADRIELDRDGAVQWTLPLTKLKAVSLELKSVLQIRDADYLYQIDPVGENTVKWSHFLWPWRQKAWGRT